MTELKCLRCARFFDKKCNLKRHYYKKNTCKPIELDIRIDILREVIDEPNDNVLRYILYASDKDLYYKYMENTLIKTSQKTYTKYIPATKIEQQNIYQIYTDLDPSIENTRQLDILDCKYCSKTFKSYNARVRHEKHRCKDKQFYNHDELVDKVLNDQTLLDDIKDKIPIELDRDDIIEAVLSDQSILKEINDIANKNNHNNNIQHTNNTTINNNNITNNGNIYNININQNIYGQENFEYIVNDKHIEQKLEKLADTNTRRFFIELFRIAFFSPKHPENKTFKLENAKSDVIKILKQLPDKWIYASKSQTIHEKILQIFTFIIDYTNIVTEGTNIDKTIEDVREDRQPAVTNITKEFETMEIINYKNKKFLKEKKLAELLNAEL